VALFTPDPSLQGHGRATGLAPADRDTWSGTIESAVMRGDSKRDGSDTERRTEALADRFLEEYPRYQYSLVEFLVAHLTDIARAFDGDLQQPLILAVIGQVRIRARRQAEKAGDASPPPSELAITASRLADVTGIPRETVRRKLKLLEARGWIARRPDGAFYLVADASGDDVPARRHFEEQDKRTRRQVARLVTELSHLAPPPSR
jgi:DNA-binding MarR family transcriptional regulator